MSARKTFDLVFALGCACSGTQLLRAAKRQFLTFPLDWTCLNNMHARAEFVATGFVNFLCPENLECRTQNPAAAHDWYVDRVNGLNVPHDFERGRPLTETYPAVREKYNRRIARFDELLAKAREVLVVWLGDARVPTRISDADIRDAFALLAQRYPRCHFQMRVIDYIKDLPRERAEHRKGTDFEVWGFDFRDYGPDRADWAVRQDLLLPYLADVEVRDYRTPTERKKYRAREREKLRFKLNARGPLDFFWARIQFKIFKHLYRKLERRGVKFNI